MRIKMLKFAQFTNPVAVLVHEGLAVSTLEVGEVYEVPNELAGDLINDGKAEEVGAAHYGAQAKPELRHDDEIYLQQSKEEMKDVDSGNAEGAPKPRRRSRK